MQSLLLIIVLNYILILLRLRCALYHGLNYLESIDILIPNDSHEVYKSLKMDLPSYVEEDEVVDYMLNDKHRR